MTRQHLKQSTGRAFAATAFAIALLGICTPVRADLWGQLPDGGPQPDSDDLVSIEVAGFSVKIACSGQGNGNLVTLTPNGGVIVYLPTGNYFGWANPCP